MSPKQRNPFLYNNQSARVQQAQQRQQRVQNLERAHVNVTNITRINELKIPRKPINPMIPIAAPAGSVTVSDLVFSLFEYSPNKAYFYRITSELQIEEISTVSDAIGLFSGMFVKAGNAHYGCWVDGVGPERIHRSADGCITWQDIASLPDVSFYPVEIVGGPDGTIWTAYENDSTNDIELWKSTDDGVTWSIIHTFSTPLSGADQISLAVDPTNADHLIVLGYHQSGAGSDDPIIVGESFNGGASFSEAYPSGGTLDGDNTLDFFKLIDFTPSGKIVACWTDRIGDESLQRCGINTGSGWSVIEMPDNEINPGFGYSADPGMGPLQIVSEDEYLFCGNVYDSTNQFRLWRTTDGGNSWTLVFNGITDDDEGMKYYYHNGTLFLANHFTVPAGGPMLLANTDPWGSGTWQTLLTRSDNDFEPAWGQAFAVL